MLALLALAAFAGLLLYAAFSDITRLIIPNWVSIALTAIFPLAALAGGAAPAAIAMNLAVGFAVLAIGFLLFQFNIIGGGDAKLLAAAAVWTGLAALPQLIVWTALAGGLLAAALLAARQFMNAAAYPAAITHLLEKQNGIPYGVAIMAGGLMTIPSLPYLASALTLP
ncbi:MAG: prepilin peptidase [Hyphomonadaceae bacterium]